MKRLFISSTYSEERRSTSTGMQNCRVESRQGGPDRFEYVRERECHLRNIHRFSTHVTHTQRKRLLGVRREVFAVHREECVADSLTSGYVWEEMSGSIDSVVGWALHYTLHHTALHYTYRCGFIVACGVFIDRQVHGATCGAHAHVCRVMVCAIYIWYTCTCTYRRIHIPVAIDMCIWLILRASLSDFFHSLDSIASSNEFLYLLQDPHDWVSA